MDMVHFSKVSTLTSLYFHKGIQNISPSRRRHRLLSSVRARSPLYTWIKKSRLVVRGGGEDFRLLGQNGGVTLNESTHDTTSSLSAKGKRGNIKEEKVLSLLS